MDLEKSVDIAHFVFLLMAISCLDKHDTVLTQTQKVFKHHEPVSADFGLLCKTDLLFFVV